jgi:ABC-2 type transport system ATP-binding protein
MLTVMSTDAAQLSTSTEPSTGGTRLGSPVLEIEGLHHRWKGPRPPILEDVNLTLRAGQVTWIGGRNGVGKTTLLRLAAGILLAQQGTVRIGELNPYDRGSRYQRQIGFLSAGDRGLYARLRVTQQLDYWARLAYVPRSVRKEIVDTNVDRFGLRELADRRVDRMSMGQRQRVRLAMAFLHEPRVILLDEPRNSLDDEGFVLLNDQVQQAAERGATVLWCSPRGDDQAVHCDFSYSLVDGHLEAQP